MTDNLTHRRRTSARRLLVAMATLAMLFSTAPAVSAHDATRIGVCCAWGESIADGISYRLEVSDPAVRGTIRRGVQAWATAVNRHSDVSNPLVLREVRSGSADIVVRYNRAGTNIQGQARRRFDALGALSSVQVTVFGSNLGARNSPELIGQITRHEVGHALGAGHADGDGHVMSPTLVGGSPTVTSCDASGVVAANAWYLVDGADAPSDPVSSVRC